MAAKTSKAKSTGEPGAVVDDSPYQPGVRVRLPDGQESALVRRAVDSVPPGWVVQGVPNVVAEHALTPLDSQASE